jgi:hypothetical protein
MSRHEYAFRPWVRSTCRKAMVWGIGVVSLLGLATWWLWTPGTAPAGRAFGVLVFYGVLFWLTLLKIWWTAGRPAVVVEAEWLGYQPLHTFSLRKIAFDRTYFCGPRGATESLRLIHERRPDRAHEFFLNLAVIDGRHEFLDLLGERLESAGLRAVPGEKHTWRRPGFDLDIEGS